ncbi:MAG: heat-inducible transcriptional repressor HrcA [Lachnospiraceae bacterium]
METGEPVGSRTISKYTDLKLSSATIRNEMADLEEMGLILQPHTSAGRIPSDKGYRLYVDHLMAEKDRELSQTKSVLLERVDRLENFLRQMAKVLAQNTNYATMISGPSMHETKLKFIQLSKVEQCKLLVVIVSEGNNIKNTIIDVDDEMREEEVISLNLLLNTTLSGLSLSEINLGLIAKLKEQAGEYSGVVGNVLEAVADAMKDENKVYTSGATNIFKYPELIENGKASALISAFEEKEELGKFLTENAAETGIQVYIGEESPMKHMRDCSVVTARYELGDGMYGTIGIVGPKRMNYEKVVGTLQSVMEQLEKLNKNDKE